MFQFILSLTVILFYKSGKAPKSPIDGKRVHTYINTQVHIFIIPTPFDFKTFLGLILHRPGNPKNYLRTRISFLTRTAHLEKVSVSENEEVFLPRLLALGLCPQQPVGLRGLADI
jgi:hypothetical protein